MTNNNNKYIKKPWVIIFALSFWILLVFGVIWPWIHQIDRFNTLFSIIAHVSATIWWCVLLWALHHLFYQIGALFKNKATLKEKLRFNPSIAIIYTTCDDFLVHCCNSCSKQNYKDFKLYICDDSKSDLYKDEIMKFVNGFKNDRIQLIQRPNKSGYKAGNLNYAIENFIKEEWILLVDADQYLPNNYLSSLVEYLPDKNKDIAFIQAANQSYEDLPNGYDLMTSNHFQKVLSPEIRLYYSRDLSLREEYGFVPMLGHGALISRSSWESLGKFPEIVSEDFAFSIRASMHKLKGLYIKEVIGYEAFPDSFGAFLIRLKKFAGGTAELLRKELIPFLSSEALLVEKWDFLLMLLWYILMPLITVNGFMGAYVCHNIVNEEIPYLHPVLPYLYTWLIFMILFINMSITKNLRKALRFYFWSSAVYTSAMPIAGFQFVKHLFIRAKFNRTPKNNPEVKPIFTEAVFLFFLGILALFCSFKWYSPFSPFLMGHGIAYISYYLYFKLCSKSIIGNISRLVVYLPGIFMLIALYALWQWNMY